LMTNNRKTSSAFVIAAFVGAIGGFAFWAVFLYFIFAFPDAQGGIGLVISPFCSATFGALLSPAVWGIVSGSRGGGFFLAFIAIFLMILILSWFISEIWQLTHPVTVEAARHT